MRLLLGRKIFLYNNRVWLMFNNYCTLLFFCFLSFTPFMRLTGSLTRDELERIEWLHLFLLRKTLDSNLNLNLVES